MLFFSSIPQLPSHGRLALDPQKTSIVLFITSVCANFELPVQECKPRGAVNVQHVCFTPCVAPIAQICFDCLSRGPMIDQYPLFRRHCLRAISLTDSLDPAQKDPIMMEIQGLPLTSRTYFPLPNSHGTLEKWTLIVTSFAGRIGHHGSYMLETT